ncbi:hypothetical protein SAMN04489727_3435 [Amycolatopsis tolypomycina]|uniref:Asp23 family, cell envelope-related function n=1 Tax=Amycolatopsis tolypomycina TaxID=208445 RepID=A0A1H4RSS5_9PSEU|nr:hypothetical protein [Amycolatopsis tolypomycina]SEC34952.1 hypothetical protein SAMN04489727_3435 [Amycolatopsis tolypomycina]
MAETEDPESDPRWDAVRRAAAHRVPTPPGLVERVLRAVAHGRRTGGTDSIGHVVDRLARTIPADGLRVSAVAVEDDVVQVLVSVRFGVVADEAAEAFRRELTAGLARQLGVAWTVNVHVVDVHPGRD